MARLYLIISIIPNRKQKKNVKIYNFKYICVLIDQEVNTITNTIYNK